VARDEVVDPRPYAELLRQWSTFHPEFAHLPRKFKIAITGAREDRAAIAVHDIGLRLVTNDAGDIGVEVWVGGGQGRTPMLAVCIRDFLPVEEMLAYVESILRVYNRLGRRDNKYKARIKILVKALGTEAFARLVDAEHEHVRDTALRLTESDLARFRAFFTPPPYLELTNGSSKLDGALLAKDRAFARFAEANVIPHRVPGYSIVALSLKSERLPPGDVTSDQMDAIADLADEYSFGRIVATHRQNLVFTDVETRRLPELHRKLAALDLATPNHERVSDVVACPGLDYCALANARSINVAEDLARRFRDKDRVFDLGKVTVNISGCINACGHHHVGNIGVLGIDKQGVEHYQLMLGGSSDTNASLGEILGRALTEEEIGPAIEAVLGRYLELRESERERFIDTYRRVGALPFKEAVYADHPESFDRGRHVDASLGRRAAAANG
jgi:sulfite reductase (NADPH) hemoprotein beta-component